MPKPEPQPRLYHQLLQSPIGTLTLIASHRGLTEIRFANQGDLGLPKRLRSNPIIDQTIAQLQGYFDGHLKTFDLPLAPQGTDFQKLVWMALRQVAHGKTASYGQIAANIGNPKAARAVGTANSKNPLPIVVPCHRIIGSDGSLTGFSGGLKIKRWLLDHERH